MEVPNGQLEWLETSRHGSFALGCVDRRLRRKYHGLLTVREPGHGDAWSVLAELHEHVTYAGREALIADAVSGRGSEAELVDFTIWPAATHQYRALGLTLTRTVQFGAPDQVEIRYALTGASGPVKLSLEPLLRCRAVHELTFENPFLDGSMVRDGDEHRMHPYAGMPDITFRLEGAAARFVRAGHWITDLLYVWELERGYEAREHLFSPGRFEIELSGDATLTLVVALDHAAPSHLAHATPSAQSNAPRRTFAQKLTHAARAYFMQTRAGGTTVVAGYPWFGPWGRDTLIALPGLYLATGDFDQAAAVLEDLLAARINGLVPNIPALGDFPANTSSIDASLLFARTVQWLGAHAGADRVTRFMKGVCELLEAIADSRDPRMHLDAGVGVWMERGPWALTWMDAMVDGEPVTPRAGYRIETDALAYNAAHFASAWAAAHHGLFARAFRARLRTAEADFVRRYWDDARGYLADGHDGERPDTALRPNQLFAIGLPIRAISGPMGRAALSAVTSTLLVPAGLRTLAPHERGYRGSYVGDQRGRDLSYHQGTAWPFLIGIYADAVQAMHGRAALEAQLAPVFTFFARHLDEEGCIGQVSEVFAGNPPHAANGTPAQAWSVAELYRAFCMMHGSDGPHGA